MLTNITETSVSILEVRDGQNWRRSYVNSGDGRTRLQADFPDAYEALCGEGKSWGTAPTVFPEPEPEPTEPGEPEPTTEELVNLMLGVNRYE